MRPRSTVGCLLLTLAPTIALGGCTHEATPAADSSSPAPVVPAPRGYRAFLTLTDPYTARLTIRTVGSSSCPVEIDDVQVAGGIVEVTDEPDSTASIACTADDVPAFDTYEARGAEVAALRTADLLVLTIVAGQRFRMSLSQGVE